MERKMKNHTTTSYKEKTKDEQKKESSKGISSVEESIVTAVAKVERSDSSDDENSYRTLTLYSAANSESSSSCGDEEIRNLNLQDTGANTNTNNAGFEGNTNNNRNTSNNAGSATMATNQRERELASRRYSNDNNVTADNRTFSISTRTAFSRVLRGNRNNSIGGVSTGTNTNGAVTPVPGSAIAIVDLPHAYPINIETASPALEDNSSMRNNQSLFQQQDHEQDQETREEESGKEFLNKNTRKILIILMSLVTLAAIVYFSIQLNQKDQNNIMSVEKDNNEESEGENRTELPEQEGYSTETTKPEQDTFMSQDTNSSIEELDHNIIDEDNTTETEGETECFTDPWLVQFLEWEAFQRGDDPSIPRTYHFCAHSIMNVYGINPLLQAIDFGSGDSFPLNIFRANVNIVCGFQQPYYDNNCTWSGGQFHITLEKRPIFVDDNVINSTAQNVTIDGFRFTNAEGAFNIGVRNFNSEGLTVRNCVFENNLKMMGSINMAHTDTHNASLTVQNCIFRNNTLLHKQVRTFQRGKLFSLPITGIIFSFPSFPYRYERDTTLQLTITDSIIQNNTFSLEDPSVRDKKSSAIINLPIPYLTQLEITNTCFIGNTEYISLILMLSDYEEVEIQSSDLVNQLPPPVTPSINLSGNTYIENKPHENYYHSPSSTSTIAPKSCFLGHQFIIYEDTLPMNTTFHIETDCLEYDGDQNNETLKDSNMCLAFA